MDADKNKKLRRIAIATRLPSDKLPSVIIGFAQGAHVAAVVPAPFHGAPSDAAPKSNPTTARKRRRWPNEQ
jgi:hypothetical protein